MRLSIRPEIRRDVRRSMHPVVDGIISAGPCMTWVAIVVMSTVITAVIFISFGIDILLLNILDRS